MTDFSKFWSSLKRLEEQYENHRGLDPELPVLVRDAVAESVIQRFEVCYDCLWKILKRSLVEEMGVADVPNSPKPLFRMAYENGLFAASIEQWFRYVKAHVDTSHDYDGEKAKACLELMSDFIDDAIGLYQTISGQTWE